MKFNYTFDGKIETSIDLDIKDVIHAVKIIDQYDNEDVMVSEILKDLKSTIVEALKGQIKDSLKVKINPAKKETSK